MTSRRWKWISDGNGGRYHDVGVNDDGTLHNPHGYPVDNVCAAIAGAEQRLHARRIAAATKAAETRRRRKEKLVYEVVQRLKADGQSAFCPGEVCGICGRGLDDPESRARGIGSDCWQQILAALQVAR